MEPKQKQHTVVDVTGDGSKGRCCKEQYCIGTVNFQMVKLDLKKAEESEIKLSTSVGSQKKQENSRKTSISASLTMPSL